jgi:hypothetical protein
LAHNTKTRNSKIFFIKSFLLIGNSSIRELPPWA